MVTMNEQERHQIECLARWVIKEHPARWQQTECLARIEKNRGKAFAAKLRDAVVDEINKLDVM